MRKSALAAVLIWGGFGCETTAKQTAAVGDGQIIKINDVTGTGSCLKLNPESEAHPVGVCEFDNRYSFIVGEKTLVYGKKNYQFALRQRLSAFMQSVGYPRKTLNHAKIQVWLKAPVYTPALATLQIVVLNADGNFAFELPIEPQMWMIDYSKVILLPVEGYPSRNARRAGYLAIAAKNYINKKRFTQFLQEVGVEDSVTSTNLALKTPVFDEGKLAMKIHGHPDSKYVIEQVSYLPAEAVDSAVGLGFSMDFY